MRKRRSKGDDLPETASEAFKAEARRQVRAIAASPREAEHHAFIDSVSDYAS